MTSVLAAFLIAVPAPWSTVLFLLISLSAVLVAVGIPWLRQRQRQGLMFWRTWTLPQRRRDVPGWILGGLKRLLRRGVELLAGAALVILRVGRRGPQGELRSWRVRAAGFVQRISHPQRITPLPEVWHILKPVPAGLLHIELLFLLIVALVATREYANLDQSLKMFGYEGEWLTSSGHYAALSLREYGYLPLWQPLLKAGEPLFESPFSFLFNPFIVYPNLILGGINGIKISVVLATMLAGLGGWVLGRILGLGSLGRVLLGLLLIGKGNMLAMIGNGYLQLGVAQAYFPWIVAGTVATFRFKHLRWPVVLTAVAFSLMFFVGNIWYTLPMLITVALLAIVYTVSFRTLTLDWHAIRRMAATAVLTFGISAVLFVPIWGNRDRIGGHPDLKGAGEKVDQMAVIEQLYNGDVELYLRNEAPGAPHLYYSYTSPLWFILLIFVALPPLRPYRFPSLARIWFVGLLLGGFGILWGVGGHPIMVWLYDHVPGLGQWRFVGRALALSSFWFATLIAIRVDSLWCAVNRARWRRHLSWPMKWSVRVVQATLSVCLLVVSLVAARDVIRKWYDFAGVGPLSDNETNCLKWLRRRCPQCQDLAVYRYSYDIVIPFLDNNIRLDAVGPDYLPVPQESTLGRFDWTALMPRFGMSWDPNIQHFLVESGYEMLTSSPYLGENGYHCLYEKSDVFSYAFVVPEPIVRRHLQQTMPDMTLPVTSFERRPDDIRLWVTPTGERTVVVVQERAYPGWQVTVDGQRARLESVGGLIGVILVPDGRTHYVRFRYRPPLFIVGGVITLLTSVLSVGYLFAAERWLRRQWVVIWPGLRKRFDRTISSYE